MYVDIHNVGTIGILFHSLSDHILAGEALTSTLKSSGEAAEVPSR